MQDLLAHLDLLVMVDFKDQRDPMESLVTLDKLVTLVEMVLTVFQVPLVWMVATEQREKQVTLVRTDLKVCPVKRVLEVYLDLPESLEDLVWMGQRAQQDETENLVVQVSQVLREVLADLEAPENLVVEENLDEMEQRESQVEEVLTGDLELLV